MKKSRKPRFDLNEVVWAKWEDGHCYEAKVLVIEKGKYTVEFLTDGIVCTLGQGKVFKKVKRQTSGNCNEATKKKIEIKNILKDPSTFTNKTNSSSNVGAENTDGSHNNKNESHDKDKSHDDKDGNHDDKDGNHNDKDGNHDDKNENHDDKDGNHDDKNENPDKDGNHDDKTKSPNENEFQLECNPTTKNILEDQNYTPTNINETNSSSNIGAEYIDGSHDDKDGSHDEKTDSPNENEFQLQCYSATKKQTEIEIPENILKDQTYTSTFTNQTNSSSNVVADNTNGKDGSHDDKNRSSNENEFHLECNIPTKKQTEVEKKAPENILEDQNYTSAFINQTNSSFIIEAKDLDRSQNENEFPLESEIVYDQNIIDLDLGISTELIHHIMEFEIHPPQDFFPNNIDEKNNTQDILNVSTEPSKWQPSDESDDDLTNNDQDNAINDLPNDEHNNATKDNQVTLTDVKNNTPSDNDKEDFLLVETTNNILKKRVWDKKFFCLYCKIEVSKFARHLERKHSDEVKVAQFLSKPKKSKERELLIAKIRNEGLRDFNNTIMAKEKGKIRPSKRPNIATDPCQYKYCPKCLKLLKKQFLWRHKCIDGGDIEFSRNSIRNDFLTEVAESAEKGFKEMVLGKMRCDKVFLAIKSDEIIMKYGSQLYSKHGHLDHLHQYIATKIRELGRFVIAYRETSKNSKASINDAIHPLQFNNVIQSVKTVAGYKENENAFTIPSLALKIGYSLQDCVGIVVSNALTNSLDFREKEASDFLRLLKMNWSTKISCRALGTLREIRYNKIQTLPLAEDLMKLQQHLRKKSADCKEKLEKKPSKEAWKNLAETMLAIIILFNRKRSGEAQRITVAGYLNRSKEKDSLQDSLSESEKTLFDKLAVVEIRGKKGRKVPILLTNSMIENVDLLIDKRHDFPIHTENPYVFARPNFQSKDCLSGCNALRKNALEADVVKPELITSTKLRKHVATMSQVLEMSDAQLETLSSFMGHDKDVHKEYYKLPQNTLYIAQISKLLFALDNGTINQFKGQKLNEIEIDEELQIENGNNEEMPMENEDENANASDENQPVKKKRVTKRKAATENTLDDEENQPVKKKRVTKRQAATESTTDDESPLKIKKTKKRWTEIEKKTVQDFMQKSDILKNSKAPKKEDCIKLMSEAGLILRNRTWLDVKNFMYNLIRKTKN